jgi:hypothetical protein
MATVRHSNPCSRTVMARCTCCWWNHYHHFCSTAAAVVVGRHCSKYCFFGLDPTIVLWVRGCCLEHCCCCCSTAPLQPRHSNLLKLVPPASTSSSPPVSILRNRADRCCSLSCQTRAVTLLLEWHHPCRCFSTVRNLLRVQNPCFLSRVSSSMEAALNCRQAAAAATMVAMAEWCCWYHHYYYSPFLLPTLIAAAAATMVAMAE